MCEKPNIAIIKSQHNAGTGAVWGWFQRFIEADYIVVRAQKRDLFAKFTAAQARPNIRPTVVKTQRVITQDRQRTAAQRAMLQNLVGQW
jgi:hypothetical protein